MSATATAATRRSASPPALSSLSHGCNRRQSHYDGTQQNRDAELSDYSWHYILHDDLHHSAQGDSNCEASRKRCDKKI